MDDAWAITSAFHFIRVDNAQSSIVAFSRWLNFLPASPPVCPSCQSLRYTGGGGEGESTTNCTDTRTQHSTSLRPSTRSAENVFSRAQCYVVGAVELGHRNGKKRGKRGREDRKERKSKIEFDVGKKLRVGILPVYVEWEKKNWMKRGHRRGGPSLDRNSIHKIFFLPRRRNRSPRRGRGARFLST